MSEVLHLTRAARYGDAALLAMRACVGAFLVWGVWDNITSTHDMQEFVRFLAKFGFPWPEVAARVSVWAQFFVGLNFIFGVLTRWAGIVCIVNFAIAIVMVDRVGGLRASFGSLCLILIGLYLATHGPGRFALDAYLNRRAEGDRS